MRTPKDYLAKKQVNRTLDVAIGMNKSSLEYVDQLLIKYDSVFTDDEKENLGRLQYYLSDTLTLFFNKLKV